MENVLTGTYQLEKQKLVSIISGVLGGYPDPDNPLPNGPWDPYIRKATLRSANYFADLHPGEPDPNYPPRPPFSFSDLINVLNVLYQQSAAAVQGRASLNPQPLPPGISFARSLAREIIDQALVISELGATARQNGKQASGAAGAFVTRFTEDLCPRPPKIPIPRPKKPFPDPEPEPWQAIELAAVAVEFQHAAQLTGSPELKDAFMEAGNKILDAAVERW